MRTLVVPPRAEPLPLIQLAGGISGGDRDRLIDALGAASIRAVVGLSPRDLARDKQKIAHEIQQRQ